MSTSPRARARPSIDVASAGSTIAGNSVTMSIRISELQETLGRLDHDPPRLQIHVAHDLGHRGHQVLARRAVATRHGPRRSRAVSHSTHSRRVSNRSGRSVRGVTRTSPASPYGRPISPIATSRPPFPSGATVFTGSPRTAGARSQARLASRLRLPPRPPDGLPLPPSPPISREARLRRLGALAFRDGPRAPPPRPCLPLTS